jgi:hypothetical protein
MRLIILPDPDTVASWVATYVKKRILAFAPTPERPFILGTSCAPIYIGVPRFVAQLSAQQSAHDPATRRKARLAVHVNGCHTPAGGSLGTTADSALLVDIESL